MKTNKTASLMDHPFVKVIDQFVLEGALDPNELRQINASDLRYGFLVDGISIVAMLYHLQNSGTYFWLEAAIGRIELSRKSEILEVIARVNHDIPGSLRLAVNPDDLIVLQIRANCDDTNQDQFDNKLRSLIPNAREAQRNFLSTGLLPVKRSNLQ